MRKGSDMTSTKEASSMPAVERYRLAVVEFRRAYSLLAADDARNHRQGFGPPPDIVSLRHSISNPDESGSLADDIRRVL
jgi:hypothetical protein